MFCDLLKKKKQILGNILAYIHIQIPGVFCEFKNKYRNWQYLGYIHLAKQITYKTVIELK